MSDNGAVSENGSMPYAGVDRSEATGWVGFVLLGGLMLVMLGAVHLGTGLVALIRPGALAGSRSDLLLPIGLTGLAWLHILLGVAAVVAGVGLFRGFGWARLTAIVLAGATALVNFLFLAVYPVWCATAIGLAAIVLYAVAAHGGEVAAAQGDS